MGSTACPAPSGRGARSLWSPGVSQAHQPPFPAPLSPTFGFGIAIKLAHSHRVSCREMGTGDPGYASRSWQWAGCPCPLLTPVPILVVPEHRLRGAPGAPQPQQGRAEEAPEDLVQLHRVHESWGTPGRGAPALMGHPLPPAPGCQRHCGWHLQGTAPGVASSRRAHPGSNAGRKDSPVK